MGILPRLSGDYPDSLWILSADRSIIREAYPAYPPQVWVWKTLLASYGQSARRFEKHEMVGQRTRIT